MSDVTLIDKCRFCNSSNIEDVFAFGQTALSNSYLTAREVKKIYCGDLSEFKAPLTYFFCKDCYAVQIRESINPEKLFSNYLYASSTSGNLVSYFKNYCDDLISRFKLSKDDFVVVVASNDGVELRNFVEAGIPAIGIEPAKNLSDLANSNRYPTICAFFGAEMALEVVRNSGQASCIVFNNCFAHLYDYHDFIKGIKILLADDGFAVFENSYLLSMLKHNLFDILYHEHSCEWSLLALKKFLTQYDLEVFDFVETPPHGGSFRCFIQHKGGPHRPSESVLEHLTEEIFEYGLDKAQTYYRWFNELNKLRKDVKELVDQIIFEGKTICGYGYPAKATTLCKFLNIGDIFEYVVEDSKFKQGLFTPYYYVPIFSSSVFKESPTDYAIVLAWNFFDLIVKNNEWYKGIWINPLAV